MKGNKTSFAKTIQRARRLAKAASKEKKTDPALVEKDFAKLTYRARQMAKRATTVRIATPPDTIDPRNFVTENPSPNGNIALMSNSRSAESLALRWTNMQHLSSTHRFVEERPLQSTTIAPQSLQSTTIAPLQHQGAVMSAGQEQPVVPLLARTLPPGVMWSSDSSHAQPHTQCAQLTANLLLHLEATMMLQSSGLAAQLLMPLMTRPAPPQLAWLRPAPALSQGLYPSNMAPVLLGPARTCPPSPWASAGFYQQ